MSPVSTPPPTILSTPSPTEIEFPTTMPAPSPQAVYLIVATSVHPSSSRLGIGLCGQLPWPPLKSDMSFFRRVTSRPPHQSVSGNNGKVENAVVMGRKTWESIPAKFRPLKGRVNVVVSRSPQTLMSAKNDDAVLVSSSLTDAVAALDRNSLGKLFVIGGSEVYRAAVKELDNVGSISLLRIIQTQVRRRDGVEIQCDTFFPIPLGENEKREGVVQRQVPAGEVAEWVGEELPQRGSGEEKGIVGDVDGLGSWLEDGDMQIRVLGWELRKS